MEFGGCRVVLVFGDLEDGCVVKVGRLRVFELINWEVCFSVNKGGKGFLFFVVRFEYSV